jgi:RNA polymerase sigma-70 factor (ECF subfamily)
MRGSNPSRRGFNAPAVFGESASPQPETLDLAALYRHQGKLVSSWLRQFGVARQDIDDLRQDILLAVLEHRARFANGSAVTTWLFSICRNVATNHRRRQARGTLVPPDPTEVMGSVEDSYDEPWRRRAFKRAVSRLNPRHRLVLQLLDLEERSYPEVARRLGLRVTSVRVLRHRAHKELEVEAARALKGQRLGDRRVETS